MASDLLQETFIRVWVHIEETISWSDERVRSWMIVIAKRVVIDDRRRANVRSHIAQSMPRADLIDSSIRPDQTAEQSETLDQMSNAIRNLPVELRTCLLLSVMDELSSEEIGALVDKPAGSVRYLIALARQRLSHELGARNS